MYGVWGLQVRMCALYLTVATLGKALSLLSRSAVRAMSRKRALVEVIVQAHDEPLTEQRAIAARELRKVLLDLFILGTLPASDIATISHWATQAGAQGIADLALKPEQAVPHGHRHLKLCMERIVPDIPLAHVNTPLYAKREARRSTEAVPMVLPSTLFRLYVEHESVLSKSEENCRLFHGLPSYERNEILQQARAEGLESQVRPIALYWDGVQYSAHDSFMGFYVTDLLSQQKFLSFLLSWALNHV